MTKNCNVKSESCKAASLAFMTVACYLLVIAPANADYLCPVAGFVLGSFGRGLATIAVIAVGVGATVGKVTWGTAIMTAAGIAILFGAASLAATLISNAPGTLYSTSCNV